MIQLLIFIAIGLPLLWGAEYVISRIEQRRYTRRSLNNKVIAIRSKVIAATSRDEVYVAWEELNEVFRQVADKKILVEIHRITNTIYTRMQQLN
jgi:hypothetical protein